MTQPVSAAIISETTHVRFIHTFDYEKIQRQDIPSPQECNTLVFSDSMGPLHPDYIAEGHNPFSVSSEEYFAIIRNALSFFASSSGYEVVIAAHPRSLKGSLDELYGSFPVFHEETPRLIASARAVIDAGGSASVGLAAFCQRPISFLSSRTFGTTTNRGIKDLARWLRVPIIDVDSPITKWDIPEVSHPAYARYVETFVKRRGSMEVPFWVQVTRDTVDGLAKRGQSPSGAA
jgi:hypothetical protein